MLGSHVSSVEGGAERSARSCSGTARQAPLSPIHAPIAAAPAAPALREFCATAPVPLRRSPSTGTVVARDHPRAAPRAPAAPVASGFDSVARACRQSGNPPDPPAAHHRRIEPSDQSGSRAATSTPHVHGVERVAPQVDAVSAGGQRDVEPLVDDDPRRVTAA